MIYLCETNVVINLYSISAHVLSFKICLGLYTAEILFTSL